MSQMEGTEDYGLGPMLQAGSEMAHSAATRRPGSPSGIEQRWQHSAGRLEHTLVRQKHSRATVEAEIRDLEGKIHRFQVWDIASFCFVSWGMCSAHGLQIEKKRDREACQRIEYETAQHIHLTSHLQVTASLLALCQLFSFCSASLRCCYRLSTRACSTKWLR